MTGTNHHPRAAPDSNGDSNGGSQSLPRTHDNIQPRLDLIRRTGRPLRLKNGRSGPAGSHAGSHADEQLLGCSDFDGQPIRNNAEVTNRSERARMPVQESTDQKVGGWSPSERANVATGQGLATGTGEALNRCRGA
jgi:hypothetical protein